MSSDSIETQVGKLAMSLLTLAMLPLGLITWGWMTYEVWRWFAPLLPFVLPALSFKGAVALRVLVAQFRQAVHRKQEEITEGKRLWHAVIETAMPLVVLPFLWLLWLVLR